MARAKLQAFRQDECTLSIFCKALSHPARVRIFTILRKRGAATFDELKHLIDLHAATLCQHLEIMSRANLLEHVTVRGVTGYRLREVAHHEMSEMLDGLVGFGGD